VRVQRCPHRRREDQPAILPQPPGLEPGLPPAGSDAPGAPPRP
jgi:hypothetical protein